MKRAGWLCALLCASACGADRGELPDAAVAVVDSGLRADAGDAGAAALDAGATGERDAAADCRWAVEGLLDGCPEHGVVVEIDAPGAGDKINPEIAGPDDAAPSIWLMGDDLRFNGVPHLYMASLADGDELCPGTVSACGSPWRAAALTYAARRGPRHPRVSAHLHMLSYREGSTAWLGGAIGDPEPLDGHHTGLDRGVLAWWGRWSHDPGSYRVYRVELTSGSLAEVRGSGADWPRVTGEPIVFPATVAYGQLGPRGRVLSVHPEDSSFSMVFDDDSQAIFASSAVDQRFVMPESGVEGRVVAVVTHGGSVKYLRAHHPKLPGSGDKRSGALWIWSQHTQLLTLWGRDHDAGGAQAEIARTDWDDHWAAEHLERRIPRERWTRFEAFVDRRSATMLVRGVQNGVATLELRPDAETLEWAPITAREAERRGGVVVATDRALDSSFSIARIGIDIAAGDPGHRENTLDLGELYFDRTSALHVVIADARDPGDATELDYQLPLRWRAGRIRFELNQGGHESLEGRWILVREGARVLHAVQIRARR